MTDINNWPDLVHVAKLRVRDFDGNYVPTPCFSEYVLVPFNEYQLGHLLGMLARSEDNGDWHGEMISLCWAAMEKWGLSEVTNNWGDRFTLENVKTGALAP